MLDFDSVMGNTFGKVLAYDVGIQWACFIVAALLKTEKFYDLAGSGTFLFLAYQSLKWGDKYFLRQKIQTGLVATWAIRLGLFLFTRVLKAGEDSRFSKVRGNPKMFFIYWTIQALWVFITLLPTLVLNNKKEDHPLCTRDYVGWALWGVGFFFEVVADYQKTAFKANPDNAGQFIRSGLWSVSRHPNYFGEILLWFGLFVSASSVMSTPTEYATVLSPVFVMYLLTRVSGIPILEKQALRRWGDNAAFKDYVKNTAVLIPWLW